MTSRFIVPYRSDAFRSNTSLEIRIPKFVATSIILEPNGKIVLDTIFVVYFHSLTFGDSGIDTS